MGGAPGTRETDLLAPDKSVEDIDALCLSGGSAFGLDAATGVTEALRKERRGFPVGPARVPIVPAAIIFDLLNGGDKNWDSSPYPALGRDAYLAAAADFDIGSVGAGTGALAATCKGGLGTASARLPSGAMVGALVVANPLGGVTAGGDRHFWAAPFEMDGEFGGAGPCPAAGLGAPAPSRKMQAMALNAPDGANTTIAIVATDLVLTKSQAQRMAVAAHDGIARAVMPAHSPGDGDLVFSVSTRARAAQEGELALLGHAASIVLARAIARGIYHAAPAPGDLIPTYQELNA